MIYNIHYIHTGYCTFPHLPAKSRPHVHPGNPFGPVFPARGISAAEMRALLLPQPHELNSIQGVSGGVTDFQRELGQKENCKSWCLHWAWLQRTAETISALSLRRAETPLWGPSKRDLALRKGELLEDKMPWHFLHTEKTQHCS